MEKETVEQFLARGGKIQRLPSPKAISSPFIGKRQSVSIDPAVHESLGEGNYRKRKLPTSDRQ